MKIACIGGGPAGLYLGILAKRSAPEHEVVIFERNRPADTFGFGVVFSDATLGNLAAADPDSHAQITAQFARWDDIEVHVGGEVLRSTGHGFCGLERKALLQILQRRAAALGVRVEYERPVSLAEVAAEAPDVIVGCDGAASAVRQALAAELRPAVDVRPNKFVWLGCTKPFPAFTFIFKQTQYGLFRVHAYRYRPDASTFIVECRDDTWRRAGLADADEDRTLAALEAVFADELAGHRLVKNRSIWRNFPTVRCGRWHAGNTVLLGDAAHTAHFSIGSGTKLAMEDAIVLRDELLGTRDIGAALAAYEAHRRPEVEALQAAAQASLEWFEGTERYARMTPLQLTYSLMTRSLRVSHASVGKRDPHLTSGVERLLAASVGADSEPPPAPSALPLLVGDRRARSRIAVHASADGDAERAPVPGAGLVISEPIAVAQASGLDEEAARWQPFVERAHAAGALIVARLALRGASVEVVAAAVAQAARADFDVALLDPDGDPVATEMLPAMVAASHERWRTGGWLAVMIRERPAMPAAAIGHAAQLVRAGAALLWVSGEPGARLPGASLADRLRNELAVATAIEAPNAQRSDLDAAIAAGRVDLVATRSIEAS